MTKRERQAREYAAERIEEVNRLGRYLRRHWLPIMRRLNYAAMVCSGATAADAASLDLPPTLQSPSHGRGGVDP
jgi:hypothetical protein